MLDPKHYCKVHLLLFEKTIGGCWHQFLAKPNRLALIMAIAKPSSPNTGNIRFEYGGPLTWDCLPTLVSENWYGIWPEATDEEKWITNQVASINLLWFNHGCCFEESSETAQRLIARYNRLHDAA